MRKHLLTCLVIVAVLAAIFSMFAPVLQGQAVYTRFTGLQAMALANEVYTNASTWTLANDQTTYGKVFFCPGKAAQIVNLPANGADAGSWMMFVGTGNDGYAPVFTAATTDTLRGPNDADLKSVTYGTGHRIGFCFMAISDGTYWNAVNLGSTTMSNND